MPFCTRAAVVALFTLLWPSEGTARPVSYTDAWTLMTWSDASRDSALLHYTFNPRTAVGLRIDHRDQQDHTFVGVQANRLLHRWNAPAAQANLYLKTGLGAAIGTFGADLQLDQQETRLAGFTQLSADWETRRWFVGGDITAHAVEGEFHHEQSGRLGVAPYVAEAGHLHTWMMVQFNHRPHLNESEEDEAFSVTPIIRFFHGNTLLEVGYSTNDEPLLNFIYRF